MKSTPSDVTSTGMCGTDWQASSTTTAPSSCARAVIASTGLTVPSMFDWCVSATTLVVESISASMFDRSSRPSSVEPEPPQRRARALAELLPRHEIGVVLHLGDDDGVAGADAEPRCLGAGGGGVRHRVRDEVDALGGVLGEHDLAELRADEGCDRGRAPTRRGRSPLRRAGARRGARPRCAARRSRARRRAPGAASARSRRCRGRPAASRREPCATGSGSRPGRVGVQQRVRRAAGRRTDSRADRQGHDDAPTAVAPVEAGVLPGAPM